MNQPRDLLFELSGQSMATDVPYTPDAERIVTLVTQKISSSGEERTRPMLKPKRWTSLILAAALIFALGVCAYAAYGRPAGVFSSGPSEAFPTYLKLPDAQQCMKDAGFTPVLREKFENGYIFRSGRLVENWFHDEDFQPAERYMSFDFEYEKDGDNITLIQERYETETSDYTSQKSVTVNGVTLNYNCGTHKVVPLDYIPTPEEKAMQEEGTLSFGYTEMSPGEEIPVNTVQTVTWQIGEMHYTLFQMNGALTSEELFEMAMELLPTA